MKYKLINIKTKEETLCEKVTSEGYDYYVNNTNKVQIASMSVLDFTVATTNTNSDLPKVVDEDQKFFNSINPNLSQYDKGRWYGRIEGYNTHKETHPFTEQDMIEFTEWAVTEFRRSFPVGVQEAVWFPIQAFKGIYERRMHTTKELLDIWKDEQTKIIYYEEE